MPSRSTTTAQRLTSAATMNTASRTARSLVAKASSTTIPRTRTRNSSVKKKETLSLGSSDPGVFFLWVGERPLFRKVIMEKATGNQVGLFWVATFVLFFAILYIAS
jgi:hypothetical protein